MEHGDGDENLSGGALVNPGHFGSWGKLDEYE
jgi:hypothetical protein